MKKKRRKNKYNHLKKKKEGKPRKRGINATTITT